MKQNSGSLLVELLIAFAIASILLPAFLTGVVAGREGKAQVQQRTMADLLLRETVEAVKSVRQNGWVSFAVNGTYHPSVVNGSWKLLAGSAQVNGLTQSVVISDLNRDSSGAIVDVGGSNDPSSKKVVVTISWSQPYVSSVVSTLYLTRYRDNLTNGETTLTQFNAGSLTAVKTQATTPPKVADDGEIILSQTGGYGDWCTPTLSLASLDLPKSGVANAVSAIQGVLAAGTGENASGVSYANVTISDPSYPTAPVATISGTFDGYKTNGVFTEANYAYLATDTNTEQVVILDLNQLNPVTKKYAKVGTLNLQSNSTNATGVYVLNNYAYVIASNEKMYIFNVANRTGSHTPISNFTLEAAGKKIFVSGTNAYIAVAATNSQLQIIDVSDPVHPVVRTGNNISVNGGVGRDVFINVSQNRAYLVTAQSSTQKELFIINLATKSVIGSYDTSAHGNMDPKGVVAVTGARVIIVGTGGQEYQVLRVDGSYEANPTWCGGVDIDTGVNGIATVFTTAQRSYSYIITGDASSELKIIEGGPGASGTGSYVSSGTFISQPIGPTSLTTGFNSFNASVHQPSANSVQMYVSVADAVNNSCVGSTYTFVGVNGTVTPFQTSQTGDATVSGAIPFGNYSPSYTNPGKCFKYKAVLSTSDSTQTPSLNDVTINYSP